MLLWKRVLYHNEGFTMSKFKDARYLGFKSVQGFEPIEQIEFQGMLSNIKHKYTPAARSLFILLYYTGARPAEIVSLTRQSFRKEKSNLWVTFPAVKHGNVGTLMLPLRNPHIKELANFVLAGWLPDYPLFSRFISNTKREIKSINKLNNEVKTVT